MSRLVVHQALASFSILNIIYHRDREQHVVAAMPCQDYECHDITVSTTVSNATNGGQVWLHDERRYAVPLHSPTVYRRTQVEESAVRLQWAAYVRDGRAVLWVTKAKDEIVRTWPLHDLQAIDHSADLLTTRLLQLQDRLELTAHTVLKEVELAHVADSNLMSDWRAVQDATRLADQQPLQCYYRPKSSGVTSRVSASFHNSPEEAAETQRRHKALTVMMSLILAAIFFWQPIDGFYHARDVVIATAARAKKQLLVEHQLLTDRACMEDT